MELSCIKCGTRYQTEDPDPYLCGPCLKEKQLVAAELDRKYNTREPVDRPMTALQAYDAQAKMVKTPGGRIISFAKAKL